MGLKVTMEDEKKKKDTGTILDDKHKLVEYTGTEFTDIPDDAIIEDSELPSLDEYNEAVDRINDTNKTFLIQFDTFALVDYITKIKNNPIKKGTTNEKFNRDIAIIMAKYKELNIIQQDPMGMY